MKITRKQLLQLARNLNARDATYDTERQHNNYYYIAYSVGVYGCNAELFQDRETGEYFVIKTRSTALCLY